MARKSQISVATYNSRTKNSRFWDALQHIGYLLHPLLTLLFCLCGKHVLTTGSDDPELIQPLDLGSLFHLKQLHMYNVVELQGQLRLNLSHKLIWCVIEHNSLGTGSIFTNQCTPQYLISL